MQFITGYEPLYHARARRRVKPEVFSYIVIFRLFLQNEVWKICPCFLGVFNKTVISFTLFGYEMIVAIKACLLCQRALME